MDLCWVLIIKVYTYVMVIRYFNFLPNWNKAFRHQILPKGDLRSTSLASSQHQHSPLWRPWASPQYVSSIAQNQALVSRPNLRSFRSAEFFRSLSSLWQGLKFLKNLSNDGQVRIPFGCPSHFYNDSKIRQQSILFNYYSKTPCIKGSFGTKVQFCTFISSKVSRKVPLRPNQSRETEGWTYIANSISWKVSIAWSKKPNTILLLNS